MKAGRRKAEKEELSFPQNFPQALSDRFSAKIGGVSKVVGPRTEVLGGVTAQLPPVRNFMLL
jgi:hypothetical protein